MLTLLARAEVRLSVALGLLMASALVLTEPLFMFALSFWLFPRVFSRWVPGGAWQPITTYAVFPLLAVCPTKDHDPNASPMKRSLFCPWGEEAGESPPKDTTPMKSARSRMSGALKAHRIRNHLLYS